MPDATPGASRTAFPGRSLGFALLVAAVAMAVYLNAVANGFALDDVPIIQENELVTEGASFGEIWTSQYWPDLPKEMALYRPLTVSSYRLEWALWDGSPRGFHATNIVLHAVASVLVVYLLASLGAGWGASLVGALVFAVHPVHVEAVANVVGRAEILATLSVLSGVLLHRRLRSPWPRRLAVGAVFFLGLASKESAVVLPLLLLVGDALVPVESTSWRALRTRFAGYVALILPLAGYLALRFSVLGVRTGTTPYPALEGTPPGTRLWTAIATLPEHLRLMLWPADLVSDYGPATLPVQVGFTPDVAVGLVVAAAALLACYSCLRRGWNLAALGLLWYGVSLLPASNLIVPVGVMLAERTLYLPSVGFAMVLAATMSGLLALGNGRQPRARLIASALVAVVLVLGAARTVTRNPTWESQAAVLETLVDEHPEHYLSFAWRGDRFRDLGQLERAVESYETALSFAPGHDRVALRLSQFLMEAGEWERALEVTEDHLDDQVKMGHVQRIRANLELGRVDAAEAALADARAFLSANPELFPDSATYYALKGLVLQARGDSAAAAAALTAAAAIQEGEEGAAPPLTEHAPGTPHALHGPARNPSPPLSDRYPMSAVIPKRVTATIDGDFVVFLIGMRINAWWKVHRWLPVMLSMRRMLRELDEGEPRGFLGHVSGGPRVSIQYWRSFEALEAYARDHDLSHWPAWVQFNKRVGRSRGDVGIWHETYRVRAGEYECVYSGMPEMGLARASRMVDAAGELDTARGRMGRGGADPVR